MTRWDPEDFQSEIYEIAHLKKKEVFSSFSSSSGGKRSSRAAGRLARGFRACRGHCGIRVAKNAPQGCCPRCRLRFCARGCGALVDSAERSTCERCLESRVCRASRCKRRQWSRGLCREHLRRLALIGRVEIEVEASDVWPGRVAG